MKSLRIAFFGSSLVSAFWNGAATYYRGIIRALHARGHRVTFYEPDAFGRQQHRDIPDPPWARVVVFAPEENRAQQMLERARGADLIVKASGLGVLDEFLERAVLQLGGGHSRIAFWDVDAPATLERLHKNKQDPFRALVRKYDLILTYGGGPAVAKAYKQLGARTCHSIYNALDPQTHYATSADPRWRGDLGFLGNRLPDREARVEEFFFAPARQLPRRNFVLGGNGWEDKKMPGNVRSLGHVYTRDHNTFNCSTTAVLNINRASMARFGYSPPTRIFEAAGAGACLISDAWEGMENFLEPGREVLLAASGPEVVAHLESLTPERARKIGHAARARILEQHTYAQRAEQFEKLLEGRTAVSAP